MTSLTWCYVAAAGWALAAALAFLGGSRPAGLRVCCLFSALAGAASIIGGVSSLIWGNSQVVSLGGTVVVGTAQLQATSLAGVFTALGSSRSASPSTCPGTTSPALAPPYTWPPAT